MFDMGNRTVPQPSPDDLGLVFAAVSDPTRRGILARLAQGTATVGELAAPFEMSLPAVSKHLKVLERAGLMERRVEGRVHYCSARFEPLRAAEAWIVHRSAYWDSTLDSLASFLGDSASSSARPAAVDRERAVAVVSRSKTGEWQIERLVWTDGDFPQDPHPPRR